MVRGDNPQEACSGVSQGASVWGRLRAMKLVVSKLGGIAQAELDIRPLTVFVGPNNTNKTWTAYSLYALLQERTVRAIARLDASVAPEVQRDLVLERTVKAKARELARALLADPQAEEVTVDLERAELFTEPASSYRFEIRASAIAHSLRVAAPYLGDASVTVAYDRAEIHESLFHSARLSLRRAPYRLVANLGDNGAAPRPLRVYQASHAKTEDGLSGDIEDFLWTWVLRSSFLNVLPFPSERKLVAALYRVFSSESASLPWVSLPIYDYAMFLHSTAMDKSIAPQTLELTDVYRERVQRGHVFYMGQDRQAHLVYQSGDREIGLPIRAASSLARSLAGLDVYLQSWACPGDILIIDEPEMNAHPEAQLAIAEFLALLVNRGIRVVFTTHSPYIVDHLSNLVEASTVPADQQDALAASFKLGTKDAFLDPEKLAVYHFQESGEVVSAFDRETRSIDWGTFSKVTDEINNLYAKILDTKRAAEGGEHGA